MWWHTRLAGFDTETTGVKPAEDRIVTAAWVTHDHTIESDANWLINPGIPIPPAATAVHGITDEKATHGGDPRNALKEITEFLNRAEANGTAVCVMNARFDLTLYAAECARHGVQAARIPCIVDPLILDKQAEPYRKGKRTLEAIAARWGVIPPGDLHDAATDATLAVRVAQSILDVITEKEAVGSPSMRELHDLQVRWASDQAQSLRAYWQGIGDGRWREVTDEWPVTGR